MICNKCNHKLPDDSEFCQYCGCKIEKHADGAEENVVLDGLNNKNTSYGEALNDILKIQAKNTIEAMEENLKTQPDNEGDAEFGLVPEKPIFTHALRSVEGEKEYLSRLRTINGEKIKWERKCSLSVDEITGIIDEYDIFLESGQLYKTIYINMYGAKTSTSAPAGFIFASDQSKEKNVISPKNQKEKVKKPINKKLVACLTIIPAVIVLMAVLTTMFLIPALKYNHAKKLLVNGSYELAYSEFLALGDYSNSGEMLLETRYIQAVKYRDAGDFELANKIFESLDDYRDSKILIHNHTYKLSETVAATCTASGNNLYKCEGCSFTYSESIDSLSHNYIVVVSESATCLKEGFSSYKCSLCGDEYSETLGISEHDYVIASTQTPTCQVVGIKNYVCSSCGNTYSEEVSKLSHSYSSATCTTPKTCTMCGLTSGNALGHSGGVVCSRCGVTTFETLTYSGYGVGNVTNVNLPKGKYNITITHNAQKSYSNFFVYFNNRNVLIESGDVAYVYQYTSDGLKDGYFNITSADGYWTITIEAIG